MAFGDYGGAVTELVITCEGRDGEMGAKGDAVSLVGDYEVSTGRYGRLFGEALKDWDGKQAIPVKVKGISRLRWQGKAKPILDEGVRCGLEGGVLSGETGRIVAIFQNTSRYGTEVDVLL